MNVPQLKEFCRGFPGATETLYEEPYNFLVYSVGGKKFAYFKTSRPERWRFTTKVSPDRFIELTDVPGVKPARYRGRFHWITIRSYCVRSAIFFLLLFLSPVMAFAVSVPAGWRLPGAADRTGEWEGAGASFHIRGDFNGDGIADEAWILFRKRSSAWGVFVFLAAVDGTSRAIKLVEERNAPAQRFVLETIRPSKIVFRTACGKEYFECAKGEPLTIQFHVPSISLCLRESSCSVFVWQPKAARFQPIRMSD